MESENERPRGKPRGITERNPQEHAQQAPLSSYKAVVESGASCGVFLIPHKRDKKNTEAESFSSVQWVLLSVKSVVRFYTIPRFFPTFANTSSTRSI